MKRWSNLPPETDFLAVLDRVGVRPLSAVNQTPKSKWSKAFADETALVNTILSVRSGRHHEWEGILGLVRGRGELDQDLLLEVRIAVAATCREVQRAAPSSSAATPMTINRPRPLEPGKAP